MARYGVTYKDVASAANQVKLQGRNVTIENVRTILGTGSITTINSHLRKWKETQDLKELPSLQNLPDELLSLIKDLWEKLIAQSRNELGQLQETYESRLSELNTQCDKYRDNNQRWQRLFNTWQDEKQQLIARNQALQDTLEQSVNNNQNLEGKNISLLKQLEEKSDRIEELTRLHKQTQDNLEHYRESIREQRLIEQTQSNQVKQDLLAELSILKNQLTRKNETMNQLEKELHSQKQINTTLQTKSQAAYAELDAIKQKLKQAETDYKELVDKNNHWQTLYQDTQAQLVDKINQLTDFSSHTSLLTDHLIAAQHILKKSQQQKRKPRK